MVTGAKAATPFRGYLVFNEYRASDIAKLPPAEVPIA